jgi:hypothetical protein
LLVWNANYAFMGALLSESGAAQIWSDGAEPTLANSGKPGAAEPVDGGYRLSGRWKILSGIHAADWFIAVGVVTENGQPRITQAGAPDIRLCAVRRDQLKVDDTWNVSGMRGTGNNDVLVEDGFTQRIWRHHRGGRALATHPRKVRDGSARRAAAALVRRGIAADHRRAPGDRHARTASTAARRDDPRRLGLAGPP